VSTHEDFSRKLEGKGPSDRSFGVVFAVASAVVGLLPMVRRHPVRPIWLGVAAAFAIVTIVRPGLLGPLNRLWFKFGLLLSRVTSPIVTGLLFYVIVTPIAVFRRAGGKDALRLRADPGAKTYWIERTPPGPDPQTMSQQF